MYIDLTLKYFAFDLKKHFEFGMIVLNSDRYFMEMGN